MVTNCINKKPRIISSLSSPLFTIKLLISPCFFALAIRLPITPVSGMTRREGEDVSGLTWALQESPLCRRRRPVVSADGARRLSLLSPFSEKIMAAGQSSRGRGWRKGRGERRDGGKSRERGGKERTEGRRRTMERKEGRREGKTA